MSNIITYTEEIEQHGHSQQRPDLETGQKFLHEINGRKHLRIVKSVYFDRFVLDHVAKWNTEIEEYSEDEYILCKLPVKGGRGTVAEIPVFVANGLIGVLSCDKDLVKGELVIPDKIGDVVVHGIAHSGFRGCRGLTKVVLAPLLVVAYEYAFANSGLKEIVFNTKEPMLFHTTAVDGCDELPSNDSSPDDPFLDKCLFYGGALFKKWEEKLKGLRLLKR